MALEHRCPRCRMNIAAERWQTVPCICDQCGLTVPTPEARPEFESSKSDSRLYLYIAGALVFGFMMITASLELRWLQARSLVGLDSVESQQRIADICGKVNDSRCVEKALNRQARLSPAHSVRHAQFLIAHRKFREAAQTMAPFIASGRADATAIDIYASALAESGKLAEAVRYFDKNVFGARKTPNAEHVRSYIKYLSRAKKFDQAIAVILRVRQKQPGAMPMEYRIISEMRNATGRRIVAGKPR